MKSKVIFAIIALIFTQACSVNGNIVDRTQITTKTNGYTLSEFTSGGNQQTTSGGYTISASIGIPMASVEQTTSGGYTVYSNLQGAINADTITKTYH